MELILKLLSFFWGILQKFKVTTRELGIAVIVFMLCGIAVTVYAQLLLPVLRDELDSLHIQDSLHTENDAIFKQSQDSLIARIVRTDAYELSKNVVLTEDERAHILSAQIFNIALNIDSIQRVVMIRELQQIRR